MPICNVYERSPTTVKLIKHMKRLIACAFIASVFAMTMTSCGKDDDKEPSQSGTLMPIPVSVVDGVRVTSLKMGNTDFSKFVYNPDGSVASATVNGVKYDFEYASTRAVEYTDSKLVRIVVSNEDGVANGYGFVFDDKTGFVTQWFESREYSEGPYYEKSTSSFTPTYNSEGRISKLEFIGKLEWNDPEEGKGSESGSGLIQYNYNGTNLVSSSYETPEEGMSVFSLGYGNGPINSFNIAPYPMYYVMGHGEASLVAGVLANLGYLGYPSSSLPTSYAYRVDGYEEKATMTYQTNSIGKVTSMNMIINDYSSITFDIEYNK